MNDPDRQKLTWLPPLFAHPGKPELEGGVFDFIFKAEIPLLHAAKFIFLNQGRVIRLVFHARKIGMHSNGGQDGVHRVLTNIGVEMK